jgi:hypothetical protein
MIYIMNFLMSAFSRRRPSNTAPMQTVFTKSEIVKQNALASASVDKDTAEIVKVNVLDEKEAAEMATAIQAGAEKAAVDAYRTAERESAERAAIAELAIVEQAAAEKAEAERVAAEKAEAERVAAEKAEAERVAAEQAAAAVTEPSA